MLNVMVALPNIGGALCSTPQSLADAHYLIAHLPCSNTAKMRKPLILAGVPQTNGWISAASRPNFTIILWGLPNVLHAARWKCRTQKIAKKSPSAHHRTTLSGYIFATKARIDNRKKSC